MTSDSLPAGAIKSDASDVSLDAKVAFLRRRQSYPSPTTLVDARETHMSWVFLIDGYAYKLKKPVRSDVLDFTTMEARRIDGERECQLNQRLAPGVYLGLVALTVDRQGQLALDGAGVCVDWLVKMRRLPAWRNLENLIVSGGLYMGDIRRLAQRLSAFYAGAAPVLGPPEEYRRFLETGIRANRCRLAKPIYGLSADALDRIATCLLLFLMRHGSEMEERARHVVEGHGDLRPEHVYLTAHPAVLDCLEFDRNLRLVDPVNELAYLAMECERLGAPAIEAELLEVYATSLGDRPPKSVSIFYKACNALLRARIAVQHLDEPAQDRAKWIGRATQYLELAQIYCDQLGDDGA